MFEDDQEILMKWYIEMMQLADHMWLIGDKEKYYEVSKKAEEIMEEIEKLSNS